MSRSDILSLFEQYGILSTPQRLEVAEILLEKPQHVSADQVIERLRKAGSSVSKATVYNTLNLFGERGIVKEVTVDPERKFYDSTTRPHHHFYNVDTGELRDIPDDQVRFSELPTMPEGTRSESIEVLIRIRDEG
jgi:Fur family iron response transcriptional regulator